MPTLYYPVAPYQGTYYAGVGSDSRKQYPETGTTLISTSSSLWEGGHGYVKARLLVDYEITGMSADISLYVQLGRTNGDYDSEAGTVTTTITSGDVTDTINSYNVHLSDGCIKRENADCTVIPDTYFTTVATKRYTLNADASGNFSKTVTISTSSNTGSDTFKLDEKTATISFSGGWSNGGKPSKPIITQTAGSNIVRFAGNWGTDGTNNAIENAYIYYKVPECAERGYEFFCHQMSADRPYVEWPLTGDFTVEAYVSCHYAKGDVVNSDHETKNVLYYTNVGAGTVTITDNYDNSFTVTATKGADGSHNPATGLTDLKWGWYEDEINENYTADVPIRFNPKDTADDVEVFAKATTTATYGDDKTAYARADIRQYIGPDKSTGLEISFSKSRLTLKEDWTLSWIAPEAANANSPVMGYRIRLYRKREGSYDEFVKLPILSVTGTVISESKDGDIYCDLDGTETYKKIYPKKYLSGAMPLVYSLEPGDQVQFSVSAYTRYGEDNEGDQLFSADEAYSQIYTISNSGTVSIKAANKWTEGAPYVKVDGNWVPAEEVYIKVNGKWRLSE